MGSLVDPSYELIDPTPDVHALFCQFDTRFFDGKLAACEVKWSPRMTTCAGICCYEGRSGLCSIKLSTPLLKLRPRKDLVETLLHEMIHAFLFVTVRDRDRDGHGPQFQWHMHRINKEAGTHITIYHSFHAEVAVYKQHHWRCEGPCRDRRPFFGWVKRASNRAPSKNDLWWAEHERTCGGKYTKVAEPKEFTEKREKAEKKKAEGGGAEKKRGGATTKGGGASSSKILDFDVKQPRIDNVFGGGGTKLGTSNETAVKGVPGGGGQRLGGGGAGRSRLLDQFGGGGRSTVAKERSTVEKENRSDDEIMVIEVPKGRPRLRGGSNGNLGKDPEDGDAADEPMEAADAHEYHDYDDHLDYNNDCNYEDEDFMVGGFFDSKMNGTALAVLGAEEKSNGVPPSDPHENRKWKMRRCEKDIANNAIKVQQLFTMGKDAEAFILMGTNETTVKYLELLRNEEAAWIMQNEEEQAAKEENEEVMKKIMGESIASRQVRSPEGKTVELFDPRKVLCAGENITIVSPTCNERGRDEEREEEGMKRKRKRDGSDDSYWESTGDEAEPKKEEEGEVEMEEVKIVRRITKALDIPIEQWIMMKSMPRGENPEYEEVKVMMRKKPVVRKEWKRKAEEWRRKQSLAAMEDEESDSKQDRVEATVAVAAAAAERETGAAAAEKEMGAAADAAATTVDQPPPAVKKRTVKVMCRRAEKEKKKEGKDGESNRDETNTLADIFNIDERRSEHKMKKEEETQIIQDAQDKKNGGEKMMGKKRVARIPSRFEPVGQMEGGEEELKLGSITVSVDPPSVQETLPMSMLPSTSPDRSPDESLVKNARG